jgi:hypothetical protein
MNKPIALLSIVLFATPLVAQDAAIPQQLPVELRKSDAIRRTVERVPQVPNLPNVPLPQARGWFDRLLNSVRAPRINAGSVEERIAALEARVEALQRDIEAQTAVIKQLQELLDRQQNKD